jgi:hypothetical protein
VYTVEWTSTAEDQLADIWLNAADPPAVTNAQAMIDDRLARNPLQHGEEVQEGLRKIRLPPLTAFDEVQKARSAVEVSAVAYKP